MGAKTAVYERGGLPELWLVDDTADTIDSPQLPGFMLVLDELFQR